MQNPNENTRGRQTPAASSTSMTKSRGRQTPARPAASSASVFSVSRRNNSSWYSMQKQIKDFLDSERDYGSYPGTEPSSFDFRVERLRPLSEASVCESIGHMIKSVLGVGILNMHVAYMFGGTWTGLAATGVIGFFACYNTIRLVKTAHKMYRRLRIAQMSFPDLVQVAIACGPAYIRKYAKCFRYMIEILLLVHLTCSCNVSQIIMAMTAKRAMEAASTEFENMQLDLRIYVVIITVPLLLIVCMRDLRYLAPFSIFADLVLMVSVLATLVYSIMDRPPLSDRAVWKDVRGLFWFCGLLMFSIDFIIYAMPVENRMRKPDLFPYVMGLAVTPLVLALCTVVGIYGYWKWGESCRSPIFVHLPMTVASIVLHFLCIVMMAVAFAIRFWVPSEIIWQYTGSNIESNRKIWEKITYLLFILLITCLTVAVLDILHFMFVMGNILLGLLTFIFPPIVESIVTRHERHTAFIRFMNVLSVTLGLVLVIGGIITFIMDIISSVSK